MLEEFLKISKLGKKFGKKISLVHTIKAPKMVLKVRSKSDKEQLRVWSKSGQ